LTVRDQFTDAELEAIRAATQRAEEETGGELVCVIVNRSDTYLAPVWQAMALGAVGGVAAAGMVHTITEIWGPNLLAWILLPALLGVILGSTTVWSLPPLRRWLVPAEVMRRRVDRRAATAFLDEEIFDTRDHTGVLLFVTLFEHQIRVLADRGVEAHVAAADWQPIVARLTNGLRSQSPGQAIVDAIDACGTLLVERGVSRRSDDRNELEDEPRLLDE